MSISDEIEYVDLNYLATKGSDNSLICRVDGDSMCDEIADGDYIVISKSKVPENGNIVVAGLNDEFTLKRLKIEEKPRHRLFLVPANAGYEPREVVPADNMKIVGVVTMILHSTV